MIVIFGAPGSGKTTQARKLADALVNGYCAVEPTDGVAPLINDVYMKVPGAAFKLQTHVLKNRLDTYIERCGKLQAFVADGHIMTDFPMFVSPRIQSGQFTHDEKEEYLAKYFAAISYFVAAYSKINLLIFLDASGKTTARRIELRDSGAETGVDPEVFDNYVKQANEVLSGVIAVQKAVINAEEDENTVHTNILAAVSQKLGPQFLRRPASPEWNGDE
jgi:deoxyadenosine/deoxycytidine kinase